MFLRGSDEDYTLTTRARLLERIRVTLAGRAAEEVLLPGGPTTYSTTDLQVRSAPVEVQVRGLLPHEMASPGHRMPWTGVGRRQHHFRARVHRLLAEAHHAKPVPPPIPLRPQP